MRPDFNYLLKDSASMTFDELAACAALHRKVMVESNRFFERRNPETWARLCESWREFADVALLNGSAYSDLNRVSIETVRAILKDLLNQKSVQFFIAGRKISSTG